MTSTAEKLPLDAQFAPAVKKTAPSVLPRKFFRNATISSSVRTEPPIAQPRASPSCETVLHPLPGRLESSLARLGAYIQRTRERIKRLVKLISS